MIAARNSHFREKECQQHQQHSEGLAVGRHSKKYLFRKN